MPPGKEVNLEKEAAWKGAKEYCNGLPYLCANAIVATELGTTKDSDMLAPSVMWRNTDVALRFLE
jgi:hypothetical protein